MAGIRDFSIGRLALLTYNDDIVQALGDEITTVGGGVVPGARRPRPYTVTLPVHGSATDADPYAAGERMRRQAVALMENTTLKLQALYVVSLPDSDINGWYVFGTGQLQYGDGGPSLADYVLQLQDMYRVGSRRTHRAARRTGLYDRRLSTTARDYLGRYFSTDFAAVASLGLVALPVGAADITGQQRVPYTPLGRTGQAGSTPMVTGMQHGEVLSYEQAEASMGLQDDVVVYDRRGRGDVPQGYGARITQDAPVAWWRLADATGATTAADSGASGLYPGTYQGSPTQQQAALTLDPGTASAGLSGRDGSYVKVADTAALRFASDFSVDGLLRPIYGIPSLIENGSFETDTVGWSHSVDPNVTDGGITRSTTWSRYGAASLRAQATSSASAISSSRMYVTTLTATAGAPIVAGRVYSSQLVINAAQLPGAPWLRHIYYDASGTIVGGTQDGVHGTAGAGVQTIAITSTAPAGAVYVALQVHLTIGTSGTLDVSMDGATLTETAAPLAWSATRPRYDVLASKWQSAAGARGWRFAYDYYLDQLVLQLSSNGTLMSQALSNPLGLAAAVQAAATAGRSAQAHVGVAYSAANGRATFYYNGAQVGQVAGLATAVFAATTTLDIGKWEADLT